MDLATGILIAAFDYSTAHADEFHDWYDLEHLPEREAVPGFGACRRWLASESKAVATYDLDTVEVLDSDPYRAIAYDNLSAWSKRVTAKCRRLLRFEGALIGSTGSASAPEGAGAMLLNAMNVAPEHEADFNAWYDEEHLPALKSVPGTLSAYRYLAREGSTHRYVAIYYLERAEVARSQAWKEAAASPWSDRVAPNFLDRVRILSTAYERDVSA
tara:strand:+ start:490 stop:1134 length:645 start_codon:yes stop_codon:yes gene_type:complete